MLAQDHPVWKELLHTGLHAVIEDIDQPIVRMCVGMAPSATWHDILNDAVIQSWKPTSSLGARAVW